MAHRGILALELIGATLLCSIRYHNVSFDMGLHYAVISYIQEHFRFPSCGSVADAYLEIMCGYPPLTHTLAATVGYLVGSPFLGMIFVTAASVFVLYAAILSMMRFKKDLASVYAAIAICIVCLVLIRYTSMIGAEVRRNYFFSQLVGSALLFGFVATQRRLHPLPSLIFMVVLGWVYPIAAVQLGCATIISMMLLREAPAKIGVYALLASAAIFLHPLFRSSSGIANNNGDIGTGYIPEVWTMPIVWALAASSGGLFWYFMHEKLPLRNPIQFISISAAIACAALVQWAVFVVLGKGSDYIVYKHLFGAFTMLVANIIVWSIVIAYPSIQELEMRRWATACGIAIAAVFCSMTIIPPVGGLSTRAFARTERDARLSRQILNSANHHEQFALEIAIGKMPITETADRHIQAMRAPPLVRR